MELPEELDDDESSEGTVTLEEEENDDGKITDFKIRYSLMVRLHVAICPLAYEKYC